MRRLLALLLLSSFAAPLAAASAAELIAAVDAGLDPVLHRGPGNPARAQALAAALAAHPDLPPAERRELQLALAEAWLDAGQPLAADAQALAVLAEAEAAPAQRARAALLRLAVARERLQGGDAEGAVRVVDEVQAAVDDADAALYAWVLRGEIAMSFAAGRRMRDGAAALAALDRALELAAARPPAWRMPIYLLRITAMERAGAEPAAVRAWLAERAAADPAAAEVRELMTLPRERLLGQPAPPLAGARLGRAGEAVDLAALRGRPALIAVFQPEQALWQEAVLPALERLAAERPHLAIIGVALGPPEALAAAERLAAQQPWPILADAEGRLRQAWMADALPALYLVGPAGRVEAVDLLRGTAEGTRQAILRVLEALAPGDRRPAPSFP